jgi:hypothetical protein
VSLDKLVETSHYFRERVRTPDSPFTHFKGEILATRLVEKKRVIVNIVFKACIGIKKITKIV